MRCHYCNAGIRPGTAVGVNVKAWDTGRPIRRHFCSQTHLEAWEREGGEGVAGPAGLRAMFRIG